MMIVFKLKELIHSVFTRVGELQTLPKLHPFVISLLGVDRMLQKCLLDSLNHIPS